MREIKFRAWYNGEHPEFSLTDKRRMTEIPDNNLSRLGNEYILMQYTGLKDKNGKEIYEGDIIEVLNEEEYIGDAVVVSVEFKNGCFVDSFFHWAFNNIKEYKREVIGNIYENLELKRG